MTKYMYVYVFTEDHIIRTPVYAICEQQRRRSDCATALSDNRFFLFFFYCTMVPILVTSIISRLKLPFVAEQAGLSLTWS